jgi:hypothetical protein
MKTGFLFLMFFIPFSLVTSAQSQLGYEDLYLKNIPLFQDIVSGGYYVDPPKDIDGHPYLESRNLEKGMLTINGIRYKDVPLSYNIFTDELITFQPVHKQKILIRSDKINSFEMDLMEKHRFVLISENSGYSHHRNGIYELLEAGEARLLRKHYKQTKAKRELGKYTAEFYGKSDFLLQKKESIQVIKKPKQAFKFLELDKRTTKARLKEKGLNFRQDPSGYFAFLTRLHNQLESQ